MPRLLVSGSKGPAQAFAFEGDALTVGRAPTNGLVIDDPLLSRAHAELRRAADGWLVADLDSRNGVRVNGRPIVGARLLAPGDEIGLGGTAVVFEPGAGPGADGSPDAGAVTTLAERGSAGGGVVSGRSQAMADLLRTVDRVAPSDATVLITGENGTGKERIARLLHERSARASGPFVVVDCPAVPAALFESELFGTERGVATGVEARAGLLETARGGTIFLDEIGDLELALQAKLLRVLQDRTVRRVGGRVPIPLDARILAATNHDLEADVERGAFRRDLHERLKVLRLHLPPLRERPEDVPLLVEHFLARQGAPAARLSPAAMAVLVAHGYPGNVRELEHAVEHARWHATRGVIEPADLPESVRRPRQGSVVDALLQRVAAGEPFWEIAAGAFLRRDVSRDDMRALVRRARSAGGGTYKGAARILGIPDEHPRLHDFVNRHRLGED
jgi:DNA-binding NtrC family response regulator